MANREHVNILRQGVDAWNDWRDGNAEIPSLRGAHLKNADLAGCNFKGAYLGGAFLEGANLTAASLGHANLGGAILRGALLCRADLLHCNLTNAKLDGADFTDMKCGWTTLGGLDLSRVKGLGRVVHWGPSTVGIDTLFLSGGQISEEFLRGCGTPDNFITYLPSLIGAQEVISFYSCFISYSHEDEEFTKRLYSRMRDVGLRVWFAPEDIKGGQKIHEQIEQAIQVHDRLLLVLSENSVQSEWVTTEIRKARRIETRERRRKLFPIRLVDMSVIQEWECFDPDIGKDSAVEVREYFIPDFSNWKDYDAFEAGFDRLLRDLRAEEKEARRV